MTNSPRRHPSGSPNTASLLEATHMSRFNLNYQSLRTAEQNVPLVPCRALSSDRCHDRTRCALISGWHASSSSPRLAHSTSRRCCHGAVQHNKRTAPHQYKKKMACGRFSRRSMHHYVWSILPSRAVRRFAICDSATGFEIPPPHHQRPQARVLSAPCTSAENRYQTA